MSDTGYEKDNHPNRGKDRHIGGRGAICPACSIGKQNACKFYTASGDLTPYAFLCGYVEKRGNMTLGREHGTYHVKGFTRTAEKPPNEKHVWESFGTLSEARKAFRTFPSTKQLQEEDSQ